MFCASLPPKHSGSQEAKLLTWKKTMSCERELALEMGAGVSAAAQGRLPRPRSRPVSSYAHEVTPGLWDKSDDGGRQRDKALGEGTPALLSLAAHLSLRVLS